MKLVVVLLIILALECFESKSENCCKYKNHRYDIGEQFMDDCNTCTCLEGGVSCTLKLCYGCKAVLCLAGTICLMEDNMPVCKPIDGESLGCEYLDCRDGFTCVMENKEPVCKPIDESSGQSESNEPQQPTSCQTDTDCDSGYFCSKDSCDDSSKGTCTECNSDTICTTESDPVCGCDGQTYGNRCEATRSCVNVHCPGECQSNESQQPQPNEPQQPTSCQTATDCDSGYFCKKDSCDGSLKGTCTECNSEMICTSDYDPVCGCDDKNYSNQCDAIRSCVNVKRKGQCKSNEPKPQQLNCQTDNDCNSGDYCAKQTCDCDQGTCTKRSTICTRLYDPVCSCDGKTYSNQCEAGRLGANVKSQGECPAPQSGDSSYPNH